MEPEFYIERFLISKNSRAFLIAEVAQAHDGSLGIAHSYIDAVADAGADAVKFQAHFSYAESTEEEQFRVKFSQQDKTRYDYWRRLEFTEEQWGGLYAHAQDRGLVFLCSVFSPEAFCFMEKLNVPAWKVSSGEVSSKDLLDLMLNTRKPILLSTGMSTFGEIESVYQRITVKKNPAILMQCTSKYPTPLTEVGLNIIDEFRSRYTHFVGISDHSGTMYPAIAAIIKEVAAIEVHVTFDKRLFGPDTSSSVSLDELKTISSINHAYYMMKSHPVDKGKIAEELVETKKLFAKSVALKQPMKKGDIISKEVLTCKKPGIGVSPDDAEKFIGRRLLRDVSEKELLRWSDVQ